MVEIVRQSTFDLLSPFQVTLWPTRILHHPLVKTLQELYLVQTRLFRSAVVEVICHQDRIIMSLHWDIPNLDLPNEEVNLGHRQGLLRSLRPRNQSQRGKTRQDYIIKLDRQKLLTKA